MRYADLLRQAARDSGPPLPALPAGDSNSNPRPPCGTNCSATLRASMKCPALMLAADFLSDPETAGAGRRGCEDHRRQERSDAGRRGCPQCAGAGPRGLQGTGQIRRRRRDTPSMRSRGLLGKIPADGLRRFFRPTGLAGWTAVTADPAGERKTVGPPDRRACAKPPPKRWPQTGARTETAARFRRQGSEYDRYRKGIREFRTLARMAFRRRSRALPCVRCPRSGWAERKARGLKTLDGRPIPRPPLRTTLRARGIRSTPRSWTTASR